MDGILLIDKPENISSHDVVVQVRHHLQVKKVGHGGTLDPLATGLLVMLLGRTVKLAAYVIGQEKEYRVTGVLGEMRDTYDAHGEVVSRNDLAVGREEIEAAVAAFPREYDQVPPSYSAKTIQGVRAYKRMREGEEVTLAAKRVKILQMTLESFEYPRFTLWVRVSSGTYIRSLVVDIAEKLGTVGYVEGLRRLASGRFSLDNSIDLETILNSSAGQVAEKLTPAQEAVAEFPVVELSDEEGQRLVHGQWIRREELRNCPELGSEESEKLVRVNRNGDFIGLGRLGHKHLKPEKILYL